MKLADQVCSLESAKRLKELGVRQVSLFVHLITSSGHSRIESSYHERAQFEMVYGKVLNEYSAFTVAELGELLPRAIVYNNQKYIIKYSLDDFESSGFLHRVHYEQGTNHVSSGGFNTEAEARAKTLIYLVENKLITL